MAQIWFGDLQKNFNSQWLINLQEDSNKFIKFKDELNLLYNKWEGIFGKEFQPIIVSDDDVNFNNDLFDQWENNEKLQSFIFQGGNWESQYIHWGSEIFLIEDAEVLEFTKDLIIMMGEDAELNFDLEVNADDGYENYSIIITFNSVKNEIEVQSFATYCDNEDG